MGEWVDSYQDNYKVIIPLNFKLPKSKGTGMSLEECVRQRSVGPVPGFNCRCTSFITDQYEVFNLDKISKVHKPRVHGKINLISILREQQLQHQVSNRFTSYKNVQIIDQQNILQKPFVSLCVCSEKQHNRSFAVYISSHSSQFNRNAIMYIAVLLLTNFQPVNRVHMKPTRLWISSMLEPAEPSC